MADIADVSVTSVTSYAHGLQVHMLCTNIRHQIRKAIYSSPIPCPLFAQCNFVQLSPKTVSFFAATSLTKLCQFLPYIHRITSHLPFCCAIVFRNLHCYYFRPSNKLLVRNRTNSRCHFILHLLYPSVENYFGVQ